MKAGDLILYSHKAIHWEDPFIATVLKVYGDTWVTVTRINGNGIPYKKKLMKYYCKVITKKEAFRLRLEGVNG